MSETKAELPARRRTLASARAPRLLGDVLFAATCLLGFVGALCAAIIAELTRTGLAHRWLGPNRGEAIAADLLLLTPPICLVGAVFFARRWRRNRRSSSLIAALGWLAVLLAAVLSTVLASGLLVLENASWPVPIH